jgi:hypothetical protein
VTGPNNYREAGLILTGDPCDYGCPHAGCQHEMASLTRAIAHAIQANTAATVATYGAAMKPADRHEWRKATDEDYAAEQDAEVTR